MISPPKSMIINLFKIFVQKSAVFAVFFAKSGRYLFQELYTELVPDIVWKIADFPKDRTRKVAATCHPLHAKFGIARAMLEASVRNYVSNSRQNKFCRKGGMFHSCAVLKTKDKHSIHPKMLKS